MKMKKISAIATSLLMAGLTVSSAVAAATNTWPNDFTAGAVVYGTGASADVAPATSISNYLKSEGSASTFEALETITEDEVPLGSDVVFTASEFNSDGVIDDGDIKNLVDSKLTWDDGTGSDDYDYHEEIRLTDGKMSVITTMNDSKLEDIALTNEMAVAYRLVFDEAINTTAVGTADADELYLSILGKTYEIDAMTATTVTVVTSEKYILGQGESVVVDGVTYTVEAIASGSIRINGEVLSEDATKKIDGLKVKAEDIFYEENYPEQRSVSLEIGKEITDTFSSGDEYIGEDEDDPLWVWDISGLTAANGYIGVKYNVNINDANDEIAGDSIKYAGESYVLPENFAEVKLEGKTATSYKDVKVTFEEADLYNASDTSVAAVEDGKVIQITAPTDSITVGGEETDTIYIYYAKNSVEAGASDPAANGSINVFYKDVDGDYTPTKKARFQAQYNLSVTEALAATGLATIEIGDVVLNISMTIAGGSANLTIEDPDDGTIVLNIGGTAISQTAGTLERLGATTEDADANDIKVYGTDVSTSDDNPIVTPYGIIVAPSSNPEDNADGDELELSVPEEKVYGIVSVSLIAGEAQEGKMLFTASEKSAWQNKNVVLVGGSCVNAATATALGLAEGTCGDAWTQATTVGQGKYLIQKVDDAFAEGKVALVVAGYEAADTAAAASLLVNNPSDVDFSAGAKIVGSSA